ncbi:MAG: hypothetical protein MJE66_12665, partial [Proteobacteria bacterium]|nr:hypothetical protein [Pseudomonadota bacterium]
RPARTTSSGPVVAGRSAPRAVPATPAAAIEAAVAQQRTTMDLLPPALTRGLAAEARRDREAVETQTGS